MIQLTPQMRVLVAIEPVDGRRGIDGLAQVCRAVFNCDPRRSSYNTGGRLRGWTGVRFFPKPSEERSRIDKLQPRSTPIV